MGSGAYDRMIQFQRVTLVDDGLASVEGGWLAHGPEVPARMKPGVGAERFANEQNSATAPSVFWFRWCPQLDDLSPKDRLEDAGRVYDVKAVRWDGRTTSEVEVSAVFRVEP